MSKEDEKQEKENNINDEYDFELIYSNDITKIKEIDNNKINDSSTNMSEGIKDSDQILENILENDKNKINNKSNFLDKTFISLDSKNYLLKSDPKYPEELDKKFRIKYQNNISEKLKELSETIKFRLLNNLFPGIKQDFFSICLEISNLLEQDGVLKKEKIEKNLNFFFFKENNLIGETILIDKEFIKNCGPILGHIYRRIKKNKIKDETSFIYAIKKVINEKIDIKYDYNAYFSGRNFKANLEQLKYFKKIRNNYIILPEIIYLINLFKSTRRLIIDVNISYKEYDDDLFYCYILFILNCPIIIKNIEGIKFNLLNEEMLKHIYKSIETKLIKSHKFISFKKNEKSKIITKKGKLVMKTDASFINEYKLINIKKVNYKVDIIPNRKSLPVSGFEEINEPKEKLNKSNKDLIIINSKTTNNFSHKKDKNNRQLYLVKKPKFLDRETLNMIIGKEEEIRILYKILEMILLIFLSFDNLEKLENVELILVDSYYLELISFFEKEIKIKIENFHIMNLIFNKIVGLKKLIFEINSFDLITFNEILNILYNSNASEYKLSLFTMDYIYSSPFLYKVYLEDVKRKLIKKKHISNNNRRLSNEFFTYIYQSFVKNLNNLFDILKYKKLLSLSLNFNIPVCILNDEKFIIIIIKFFLNIFIFYFDDSESKTEELSILSPSLVINGTRYLFFDEFLCNNNINNKSLLMLNIRFKFYNIKNLYKFIPEQLRILILGDIDIFSFKYLVNNITKYKFIKSSSLQQLSLRINDIFQTFDKEIKLILAKLFNIHIQNLLIYLYTNIQINKDEFEEIIDILQNNWILCYNLSFNNKSKKIIKQNYYLLDDLESIIPREPEYSKLGFIFEELMNKKENKIALINSCLKYFINKANNSKQIDFYLQKKISSNIFSYLYKTKKPIVNFHEKDI